MCNPFYKASIPAASSLRDQPMPKSVLFAASILSGLIAAYFLYSGFTLNTNVGQGSETIANLQLMHIQTLNFMTGIGAAIISAIFATGSAR